MSLVPASAMDGVASGAVIGDLLDVASSSLDDLATQAHDAMPGTWFQQHLQVERNIFGASKHWEGDIGPALEHDPRRSEGVRNSAEGVQMLLDESTRFADSVGDVGLSRLLRDARERVADSVEPIVAVDRIPGRSFGDATRISLRHGPRRLEQDLVARGNYTWATGERFDERWVDSQLATARREVEHASNLARLVPERALLRAPADEIADGALQTLRHTSELSKGAKLGSADLHALATGVEGLAEHVSSVGRSIDADGALRMWKGGELISMDRAAFDSHVAAVGHTLDRMAALSRTARSMAPRHVLPHLDALDHVIVSQRADISEWTHIARVVGDKPVVTLDRYSAPGVTTRRGADLLRDLHGQRRDTVEGRLFTRTRTVAAVNPPFVGAAREFADVVAGLRTEAGDAGGGGLVQLSGRANRQTAQDAIAVARERYSRAIAGT